MDKQKLLQETIDYYTADPSRRCLTTDSECFYSPEMVGKTYEQSHGCAIGRLLGHDQARVIDDYGGAGFGVNDLLNAVAAKRINVELPEWMFEEREFLVDLQAVHDIPKYWNERGLTEAGVAAIERYCRKNEIDFSQIKIKDDQTNPQRL